MQALTDLINDVLRRGRIMSIVLHGVAAGKGIAIGHAHLITRGTTEVPQYDIDPDKLDAEVARSTTPSKPRAKNWNNCAARFPKTPRPNWAHSFPCT